MSQHSYAISKAYRDFEEIEKALALEAAKGTEKLTSRFARGAEKAKDYFAPRTGGAVPGKLNPGGGPLMGRQLDYKRAGIAAAGVGGTGALISTGASMGRRRNGGY